MRVFCTQLVLFTVIELSTIAVTNSACSMCFAGNVGNQKRSDAKQVYLNMHVLFLSTPTTSSLGLKRTFDTGA